MRYVKSVFLCCLFLPYYVWGDAALTLLTADNPPFNFSTDNGVSIKGAAADIIAELMHKAQIQTKMQLLPWKRALILAEHQPDTCAFSAVRTIDREPRFKWVGPLLSAPPALFALKSSKIRLHSLDDAKKYLIGSYTGSVANDTLQSHHLKLDIAPTERDNLRKLQAGRIDLWVAARDSGPYFAKQEKIKIKIALEYEDESKYQMYLACNHNLPDQTVKKLNAILDEMRLQGRLKQIEARYQ